MQPQTYSLRRTLFTLAALVAMLVVTLAHGARLVQAAATDLFFSEYIEGSSNNKALEIYNGTGAPVNLATGGYNVQMYFNGSVTAALTINLTGAVAPGDVYVVAQSAANATILAQADQTNGSGWFNGDDAVVLRKGTTVLDVIGQIGFDPGTEWGTGLTSTADNTLSRKPDVCGGDVNGADAFDPAAGWNGSATDTFGGLGAHLSNCEGEAAPMVTGSTPANGAVNVALNGNLTAAFSEPVNASSASFSLNCASTLGHTVTVSGGPSSYILDPDTDFGPNEVCTVNVVAAFVTDQDAVDPPDNMAADHSFSFTTNDPLVCFDASTATLIHAIQGSGATSPMIGANVIVEGVVVGDYQGAAGLRGFYLQEEDPDSDADGATSEGVFVFDNAGAVAVELGQVVRVKGSVVEFAAGASNLTEIGSVSEVAVCGTGAAVTPVPLSLPIASLGEWERYEGMRVSFDQQLTATENFTLGRFGEVALSANGRLYTPTHVVEPGAAASAQQDLNNRSRILLDDGNGQQNIDPTRHPVGGLSASNTLRSGYTVSGLSGVLDDRFGAYRVQPVGLVDFAASNPRPTAPAAVGGDLRVAAINVLNYFNGDGLGGGFPTPRGANTMAEYQRQHDKIISAILGLDADVIGLMEIENDAAGNSAIEALVAGLNDDTAPGTYAFINTGVIGADAIRVALIYKPANATPVGGYALLTTAVNPLFIDTLNRPALAQTFDASGGRLTVVVNHLKSKGSNCNAVGDPDTGDGQGNCNITRRNAAQALVSWLNTDPTGSGDTDFLVIGDLNSYAREDPIDVFTNAGYTNLISQFAGTQAYSFVFNGQSGYLDHALASPTLAAQVTGATEWHINADEPIVLDYNVEFKTANQVNTFYAPDAYRASDHDPLLVGLNLAGFNFTGFFSPVDNLPAFNKQNAGSTVPVKFSLGGDQGLGVFVVGYPKSEVITCDSAALVWGVESTNSNAGLNYSGGQYHYNWKTEKAWAGACRQLVIVLSDGSVHRANFRFK